MSSEKVYTGVQMHILSITKAKYFFIDVLAICLGPLSIFFLTLGLSYFLINL